jgi:hypothetical protein
MIAMRSPIISQCVIALTRPWCADSSSPVSSGRHTVETSSMRASMVKASSRSSVRTIQHPVPPFWKKPCTARDRFTISLDTFQDWRR